jgi:DNA-directed RNA polymerase subunit K/omega
MTSVDQESTTSPLPKLNSFELVCVIALRAAQLMRGCTARVPASHRAVLTARREVEAGLVRPVWRAYGAIGVSPEAGRVAADEAARKEARR